MPVVVPETDVDGAPWTDEEQRIKALGYRRGSEGDRESASEYSARVGGMMRVYFHVLRTPVDKPLHRLFQTPRVWGFFARMTGEKALLDSPVAPVVLHGEFPFHVPVCQTNNNGGLLILYYSFM